MSGLPVLKQDFGDDNMCSLGDLRDSPALIISKSIFNNNLLVAEERTQRLDYDAIISCQRGSRDTIRGGKVYGKHT